MKAGLQVSLYPLGTAQISDDIYKFVEILENHGLKCVVGNMSTFAYGDIDLIFDALKEAFSYVSSKSSVVMVSTISNACAPLSGPVNEKSNK